MVAVEMQQENIAPTATVVVKEKAGVSRRKRERKANSKYAE
jgi:hypothetical protein